jgi:murein DD-endopeptidase MepM/ murein hydrolase activator NlpD
MMGSQAIRVWETLVTRRGAVLAIGVPGLAMAWAMGALVAQHKAAVHETTWLRQRLSEKRALVRSLQADLGVLAQTAERVAQMASIARDENALVRQLAQVDAPRDGNYTPARLAAFDDATRDRSEDAARALAQLAFLEEQLAETTDSLGLLSTLAKPSHYAETDAPHATPAVARIVPAVADTGRPSGWPVHGEVSSHFGWRESPYGSGTQRHTGLDIIADYGTPVSASAPGLVLFAGRDAGGYGMAVVIDHGRDVKTLYGHLSGVYVRAGQRVARGSVIGAVGSTGRSTGVHLHYEVRVANVPVDPMAYVGSGLQQVALVSDYRRSR